MDVEGPGGSGCAVPWTPKSQAEVDSASRCRVKSSRNEESRLRLGNRTSPSLRRKRVLQIKPRARGSGGMSRQTRQSKTGMHACMSVWRPRESPHALEALWVPLARRASLPLALSHAHGRPEGLDPLQPRARGTHLPKTAREEKSCSDSTGPSAGLYPVRSPYCPHPQGPRCPGRAGPLPDTQVLARRGPTASPAPRRETLNFGEARGRRGADGAGGAWGPGEGTGRHRGLLRTSIGFRGAFLTFRWRRKGVVQGRSLSAWWCGLFGGSAFPG